VTLIEGSKLQHAQHSILRRGNMDITVVHMNLIDAQAVGRHDMGLESLVDNIVSWRMLVS
jgi:hypothetical protein